MSEKIKKIFDFIALLAVIYPFALMIGARYFYPTDSAGPGAYVASGLMIIMLPGAIWLINRYKDVSKETHPYVYSLFNDRRFQFKLQLALMAILYFLYRLVCYLKPIQINLN